MMCLRCESQEGILAYSPMHRFRVMWIRDRHVVRQEEEGGTLGDAEERHLEPSRTQFPSFSLTQATVFLTQQGEANLTFKTFLLTRTSMSFFFTCPMCAFVCKCIDVCLHMWYMCVCVYMSTGVCTCMCMCVHMCCTCVLWRPVRDS